MKNIYHILSILLLLLITNTAFAQGWVRNFPDEISGGYYLGSDVVQAPNSDFISCGQASTGSYFVRVNINGDTLWTKTIPATTAGSRAMSLQLLPNGDIAAVVQNSAKVSIVKLDANGNLLTTKLWNWSGATYPNAMRTTTDGGFVVTGTTTSFGTNGGSNDMLLAKTDALGDTVWTRCFGDSLSDYGNEVRQTVDGGFVATGVVSSGVWGSYMNKMYVVKVDANGNLLWEKKLNSGTQNWEGHSIQQTLDGGYIITGHKLDTAAIPSNSRVMLVTKLDANGNIEWTSDALSADLDCAGLDIIQNKDSSYVTTGFVGNSTGPGFPIYQLSVVKLDKQGTVLWQKFFFNDFYTVPRVKGESIKATSDGGYIIGGTNFLQTPYWERMVLLKLDSAGNAITTNIVGNVYADLDDNCNLDTLESPLQNWVVVANGNNGQTYYNNTDSLGNYNIEAEFGTYDVTLAVPNPYWDTTCIGLGTVILDTIYDVDTVDFPVSALVPCPLLHVDISAPFLRLCTPSYYYVQYCNWGMAVAQNTYVQVELDSFITYNSSTVAATHLGGNLYQFNIGNLAPGQCGTFQIQATVDCDTSLMWATHCTQAHIYPDSICNLNWTGPNINLEVNCLGDSIHFLVNNSGGNMNTAYQYDIFEDNVMMRTGSYNLPNGQTENIFVPTLGGKTYRIEARQDPNFPPLLGDTIVALALEACSLDTFGNFSTGFVTQFCNYDGSPFIDIDCQPNIGPYDPNDKLAYPVGYGTAHYIYQHTDLEYYIRFQNTGNDTAQKVVLIDTISPYLDIASLVAGASSHPYTYEISGNGVIKFTFDHIMLPDSNVNEPASHGFVKFKIEQVANNPIGTIINNNADIYFDYNAPIRTNTTFHEIGQDFVTIQILGTDKVEIPNTTIQVYPNPFEDIATVVIEGNDFIEIEFELFDAIGNRVYYKSSQENQFQIQKADLPQGLYIYRIIADGKLLNAGKLIAK